MDTVNENQTFSQLLESNLTKEVYDNLTTELSIGKRKLTMLRRNPQKLGTIELAVKIASLLGMTTKELIDTTGFGQKVISLSDYKKLT